MPPRKTVTKNSSKAKTSRKTASRNTASFGGPQTTRAHCCDGCAAEIPEAEALKCKVCGMWLHRYCAGIPTSYFTTIAASFVCAACSLTASNSVILELRGEINALKAEIIELRAAMEDVSGDTLCKATKCWKTSSKIKRICNPSTYELTIVSTHSTSWQRDTVNLEIFVVKIFS